jgi:lycopene cyclase domain-containing protein
MATYLTLNIIVMAVSIALLYKWLRRPTKACIATLAGLLILTAVFDNVIIGLDIVRYDTAKILGIYIGLAPIEDFMYPLLAVIMIPVVWRALGSNRD